MTALALIFIGIIIGLALASSGASSSGGGYRPVERGPMRVTPAPRPPGTLPPPPPARYIMRGVRMPWDPYPKWMSERSWTLDELPDTKWAREIKARHLPEASDNSPDHPPA